MTSTPERPYHELERELRDKTRGLWFFFAGFIIVVILNIATHNHSDAEFQKLQQNVT